VCRTVSGATGAGNLIAARVHFTDAETVRFSAIYESRFRESERAETQSVLDHLRRQLAAATPPPHGVIFEVEHPDAQRCGRGFLRAHGCWSSGSQRRWTRTARTTPRVTA